jgi:hypothetical protein
METRRNSVKMVTPNLDFDVGSSFAGRRDRSAIASFDGELIMLPETKCSVLCYLVRPVLKI